MTSWRLVAVAGLVASLACATSVRAEPPCLADIKKLCPEVPGSGWLIQSCLEEHEADLSKGCRAHLDDFRHTAGDLADACAWDAERFCGDESPGGGRIAGCLQQHREQLSPRCKKHFGK